MPYRSTVLYPNVEDARFDKVYYTSIHIPLVLKQWAKHGLRAWDVVEYEASPAGVKPPFIVGSTMVWESPEHARKALASEDAAAVFADRPNFTNTTPIFMNGTILASSSG